MPRDSLNVASHEIIRNGYGSIYLLADIVMENGDNEYSGNLHGDEGLHVVGFTLGEFVRVQEEDAISGLLGGFLYPSYDFGKERIRGITGDDSDFVRSALPHEGGRRVSDISHHLRGLADGPAGVLGQLLVSTQRA